MCIKENIVLIGFSNRQKMEIFPALKEVFPEKALYVCATSNRLELVENEQVSVSQLTPELLQSIRPDICVISVPQKQLKEVKHIIEKSDINFSHLYLDTPMLNVQNYHFFKKRSKNVYELQDYRFSLLIDFLKQIISSEEECEIRLINMLWNYHGYALMKEISRIFGCKRVYCDTDHTSIVLRKKNIKLTWVYGNDYLNPSIVLRKRNNDLELNFDVRENQKNTEILWDNNIIAKIKNDKLINGSVKKAHIKSFATANVKKLALIRLFQSNSGQSNSISMLISSLTLTLYNKMHPILKRLILLFYYKV